MSLDLWTHEYCLACDRQVEMNGEAYCSEACRMADFETSPSLPGSQACSPTFPTSYPWSRPTPVTTTVARPAPTKFYLSPAYDFGNAQPYGSTPPTTSSSPLTSYSTPYSQRSLSSTPSLRDLTPSSSHSSLCSMRSTSTAAAEEAQLSAKSRMELRAYAVSFEQLQKVTSAADSLYTVYTTSLE